MLCWSTIISSISEAAANFKVSFGDVSLFERTRSWLEPDSTPVRGGLVRLRAVVGSEIAVVVLDAIHGQSIGREVWLTSTSP